jgi:hypothetical protein
MKNRKVREMAISKDMRIYGRLFAFSLKLNSETIHIRSRPLILLHFTKEQTKIYTKITPKLRDKPTYYSVKKRPNNKVNEFRLFIYFRLFL